MAGNRSGMTTTVDHGRTLPLHRCDVGCAYETRFVQRSHAPGQSPARGLLNIGGSLLAWPIAAALAIGLSLWGSHTSWWINIVLFLVVGRVGTAIGNYSIRFWIKGRQHLAPSGQEVQESDSRPPVLYLRAFDTDKLTTHTVPSHKIAAYRTEEQQVARAFARFGPMLTLGRPGEPLPLVGAARSYVTHERPPTLGACFRRGHRKPGGARPPFARRCISSRTGRRILSGSTQRKRTRWRGSAASAWLLSTGATGSPGNT
jgi:hypothetical protein